MSANLANEIGVAGAKAAPAVTVVGASAAGISLQDGVFLLTMVYLVLQCAYLIWKWRRERKAKR